MGLASNWLCVTDLSCLYVCGLKTPLLGMVLFAFITESQHSVLEKSGQLGVTPRRNSQLN